MAGLEIPRVKLGNQGLEVNLIKTEYQIFECPLSFFDRCSVILLFLFIKFYCKMRMLNSDLHPRGGLRLVNVSGDCQWMVQKLLWYLFPAFETMELVASCSLFVSIEVMACNWRHKNADHSWSVFVFRYLGWGSDAWAWVVSTTLHFPMRMALQ